MDAQTLFPASLSSDEFYIGYSDPENSGDEFQQMGVGLAIDGWGCDTDFEAIPVWASDFISA